MSSFASLLSDLQSFANPAKAAVFKRFFKTGKGEYGEGDKFLGLTTPQIRGLVKRYWKELSFDDLHTLLQSPIHEHRTVAVAALCTQFEKKLAPQKEIFDFYLARTNRINNWDLVDISCPTIVGIYLLDKDRKILYRLSRSSLLWDRRISIISTFAFIRANQFNDTLKISEILLKDKHDLIHKAVGWMLREVGKRDKKTLVDFLDKFTLQMPRTALRYAIEKFPEPERQHYLSLK